MADLGLLEKVIVHKNLFFRSAWANFDTAKPGTIRLVPSVERHSALKADYRAMQESMIFGDFYSFEELMGILAEIEAKLNATG